MNDRLANLAQKFFRKFGMEMHYQYPYDFSENEIEIISTVRPYTQTSARRIKSLINAVEYIISNKIEGDFVECGVWKGGSIMTMAKTLTNLKHFEKDLYLFDTFEGINAATDFDVSIKNETGDEVIQKAKEKKNDFLIAYVPLEQVKNNVFSINYPKEKFHFVKGTVEETLPEKSPKKISLLRLDTDWYESTKHELVHLFPLISKGGVIIIDDYGYWTGAKKAVDEYFSENNIPFLPNRIDSSGRIGVKI